MCFLIVCLKFIFCYGDAMPSIQIVIRFDIFSEKERAEVRQELAGVMDTSDSD